jgi:hypothetical protein
VKEGWSLESEVVAGVQGWYDPIVYLNLQTEAGISDAIP